MKINLRVIFFFSAIFLCLIFITREKKFDVGSVFKSPVYHLKNYSFDPDTSLASRCTKTPDIIMDSLRKMDGREDYIDYQLSDQELNIGICLAD